MAYARLAGMPPIYGLYTNMIPTITYVVFGTSKHAAIGKREFTRIVISRSRFLYRDCYSNVTNDGCYTIQTHTLRRLLAFEL